MRGYIGILYDPHVHNYAIVREAMTWQPVGYGFVVQRGSEIVKVAREACDEINRMVRPTSMLVLAYAMALDDVLSVTLEGLLVFRSHPELFGPQIQTFRARPSTFGLTVFTIEQYPRRYDCLDCEALGTGSEWR